MTNFGDGAVDLNNLGGKLAGSAFGSKILDGASRTSSSDFNLEGRTSNVSSTIPRQEIGQLYVPRSLADAESMTTTTTTTTTQYLPRVQQHLQQQQQQLQQSFLNPADIAAANWNNNAPEMPRGGEGGGGGRGGGVVFSSSGVEGRAAPMRPGEGDCSVMVAAQNLMANYIPVFNPKVSVLGVPKKNNVPASHKNVPLVKKKIELFIWNR